MLLSASGHVLKVSMEWNITSISYCVAAVVWKDQRFFLSTEVEWIRPQLWCNQAKKLWIESGIKKISSRESFSGHCVRFQVFIYRWSAATWKSSVMFEGLERLEGKTSLSLRYLSWKLWERRRKAMRASAFFSWQTIFFSFA